MPTSKHYANAPITEALIDIQVELSGVDVSRLESIFGQIKEKYPVKKDRISWKSRVTIGKEFGTSANQTHDGFAFYSLDGKQIFQARLDGFTFNRLRPYGSWLELRDEAKSLWDIYRQCVEPVKMTRIAVRYINQIDLPLPIGDFTDYLRTVPEISPDLPDQALSNFMMRLEFPQLDLGSTLVLSQSTTPLADPEVLSIILDIDVIRQDVNLTLDDSVWQLLDQMRIRKNEFFEACITDKTRALFGPRN